MSKIIRLTKGKSTIVDDDDYSKLARLEWHALPAYCSSGYYAKRSTNPGIVLMHRTIMDPKGDEYVDHINGNGLDNRRENLRVCSPAQNQWNWQRPSHGVSEYVGVYKDFEANVWEARIVVNGNHYNLGRYNQEKDAARAYDRAVIKYRDEHASVNLKDSRDFDFESWQKRVEAEQEERKWLRKRYTPPEGGLPYKGVGTNGGGYYIAKIQYKGDREYLGGSYNAEEAARLYDERAYELYDGDCYLNFPSEYE